ncbi:MAG TPA: ABC transporter ATP-binding protein [Frankiaceae bacterium]|nr:ABC transporter ATP-binding protein [Frankiaceae bacterium]
MVRPAKPHRHPIRRVLQPVIQSERKALGASALLGTAAVAFELARPWPLALAVDYAIARRPLAGLGPQSLLLFAGAAVVLFTLIAESGELGSTLLAERAAERVGARLRQDVYDRATTLSLRWHDRMRSGELVSRLTTDVGRLLDALVAVTAQLLPDVVRLLLVLILLTVVSPGLALLALAVVPLLAVFAVRQRRRVRIAQQRARAEAGLLAASATDLFRNVRAVQAFSANARPAQVFHQRNAALLDVNVRAVTTEARWSPVANVVLAIGTGLVLVVGGREVLDGRLSTGDLLVVTAYLSALYSPVRGLSRLSGLLAKSNASAARIQDVLACTEEIAEDEDARPAPPLVSGLWFADVRFGYQLSRPVLDGFDLTVAAGQTCCVLGPSGAGKSTVLHLLLRLYDVDAGGIMLDGVDLRSIRKQSLRQAVAFVPQDPWLFDTTIAQNIALGAAGADRAQVLAAGRAALVDEFAHQLPGGYDSLVGEAAAQLSGGQRRRIALARAVVSKAPLMLLDEPTASLDPASAAAVITAIERCAAGRTVLMVTHDPLLAAIADQVVTLDPHRPAGVNLTTLPGAASTIGRR